jgi:hypothetical protein
MLLSLTHGAAALISVPLWGVAGGLALHEVRRTAAIDYPRLPWTDLGKGARFPQGLPAGFDIASLTLRSPEPKEVKP